MSVSAKRRWQNSEEREKQASRLLGVKPGGASARGYKLSETHRMHLTDALRSPEVRAKLSSKNLGNKSRLGQVRTVQERAKQSDSLRRFYQNRRLALPTKQEAQRVLFSA
jgi:spore coat protein CotH